MLEILDVLGRMTLTDFGLTEVRVDPRIHSAVKQLKGGNFQGNLDTPVFIEECFILEAIVVDG